MTEGTTDSEDNHQSGANNSSAGLVKVEQGSVSGEDPLDMAGADRASSRQFADEIRQLELEGTRLMAATSNLSDNDIPEEEKKSLLSSVPLSVFLCVSDLFLLLFVIIESLGLTNSTRRTGTMYSKMT
ncbi:hypothetical protein LSH36_2g07033 [Paralvinella palmiformis]|uniref:Uncharacterized protein n=1 Tax=Paralvinella palmiformis TaxID=53620 RepID=A0AAD9NJ78_9ANNE|nr:hypothetical protein LSH36_2g07033 [Paralvinella palmiformis]